MGFRHGAVQLDAPAPVWQDLRPMRPAQFSLIILGLLGGLSCRTWEDVRKDFVDPVNKLLHIEYPRAWKAMQLEGVLEFYAPELASQPVFKKGMEDLMGRFTNIEHAACILDGLVQLGGEDKLRTRILLKLWGEAHGGARLAFERWSTIVCERREGRWWISGEVHDAVDDAYDRSPAFKEEGEARGLTFRHASRGVTDKHGIVRDYTAGGGLGVGDYDSDGREDVYLVSGAGGRLFRNTEKGAFRDVTSEAGLDQPYDGEGRFAVFADYDNDGHTGLFVGILDAPNRLYRNRGDNTYEDVAQRAGLKQVNETVGAAFADFNRDGHLDLYLVNGGNLLRKNPDPIYNAKNATANQLYISNGDGTFTDRTEEAGAGDSGWGLAVSTADYDLDGDTDIFVGNDVGRSILYRNNADGTFTDVAVASGVPYRGSTMSAAWGDINGDGYPELFAPAMDSNSRWMIDQPGFPSPAQWYVNLFIRPIVLGILKEMLYGNRFYLNKGDGTFQEMAETCGVRRAGWAWSGVFLDYDNDAALDMYCVNGFLSGAERQDL